MIPTIDPRVKYVGTSYLRGLNAEALKTFAGAVVVQDGEAEPLVVIVPYATYLEMQEARAVNSEPLMPFEYISSPLTAADLYSTRRALQDTVQRLGLEDPPPQMIRSSVNGDMVIPAAPNMLPCRHCGVERQIHPRVGVWRACSDCQRGGHFNTSDCRRCGEIQEAKRKAASPTGIEDESVNYDWKEPA